MLSYYKPLVCIWLLMLSITLSAEESIFKSVNKIADCNQFDQTVLLAPFEKLHAESIAFAKSTCKNLVKNYRQSIVNKEYLTNGAPTNLNKLFIKNLEEAFPESIFPGMKNVTELWESHVPRTNLYPEDYKGFEFTIIRELGSLDKYSPQAPIGRVTEYQYINEGAMENHCNNFLVNNQDGCIPIFKSIGNIMHQQSIFINSMTSDKVYEKILIFDEKWNNYTNNSRFQTFVDAAFTSWWHKDHFTIADRFVSPPPYQMFALHPSIVIDHFSEAEKGNKDEVSVALEWVGVNFWDATIPWGVSFASVYTDRIEGRSIGTGLMFHLNNRFSFGFARRGNNENSFYINIDLMDWFGEKQNKLETYKTKIK